LPIVASADAIVDAIALPSAPCAIFSFAAISWCARLIRPLPPTGWSRMLISWATVYEWLPSIKVGTGQIYQLGRLYEHGMPLFGSRHYSLTIPGGPAGGPFGIAKLVYNDEMVSGEIGQVGPSWTTSGTSGRSSATK